MFKLIQSRHKLSGATVALLLLTVCPVAQAQNQTVSPTAYDRDAASQVQNATHRASPANTPAGRAATSAQLSSAHPGKPGGSKPSPWVTTRYPGDLQYHGGTDLPTVEQHLIYVNVKTNSSCSTIATCWGDPYAFLRDLGHSDFIHILDQYIGRSDDNRYTVSPKPIFVNYSTGGNPMTDGDMQTIVHAAVMSLRGAPTGYDNLYHILLPPGQDQCFDSTYSDCYSPDDPNTFYYCHYLGAADFADIGHVLYTVQPSQNVPGCWAKPGTPNGQLATATNDAIEFDTFITITDPDLNAWWVSINLAVAGEEISDLCEFNIFSGTEVHSDPVNVKLNGRIYAVNPEYENSVHACTIAP